MNKKQYVCSALHCFRKKIRIVLFDVFFVSTGLVFRIVNVFQSLCDVINRKTKSVVGFSPTCQLLLQIWLLEFVVVLDSE